MSFAYLRNGTKAAPKQTYFDLQPVMQSSANLVATKVPMIPEKYESFIAPLIPSAIQQPSTRQVLGLKQTPFSMRSGKDAGHPYEGVKAHQGYGRHQLPGFAKGLSGKDHLGGDLLIQADSQFAGLNSRIPLPP